MTDSVNQSSMRALAVIVLYKLTPSESAALRTLLAAVSCLQHGQADIRILLYDNTPGGQDPGVLPAGVVYKADIQNGGLAPAYNYALKLAYEAGCDWLLTLDQDTSLPADFLVKLCHAAAFVAPLPSVAAIVPCLSGGGRAMSPWARSKYWIRPARFPEGFIGIPAGKVFAANSASTLRVSALRTIGGYDRRFHLWASDLVLYSRLHSSNFSIFVAGNIHVEHEASILDLKRRSTPERYEEMFRADEAFCDEFMGSMDHIVLLLITLHRLAFRIWTTGGDFSHFRIALKFLLRGLFLSRRRRLKSWNQSVEPNPLTNSVPLPD